MQQISVNTAQMLGLPLDTAGVMMEPPVKRGPGRPKGSKNKPKVVKSEKQRQVEQKQHLQELDWARRQKARDAGESRYQSVRPCKRGHTQVRYTSSGGCVECSHAQYRKWYQHNKKWYNNRRAMKRNESGLSYSAHQLKLLNTAL